MKLALEVGISILLTLSPPAYSATHGQPRTRAAESMQRAVHTHEQFEFVADAPIEVVWPLFGADAERAWAPDWNPLFVWPEHAADQQGMVFKIAHGDRTAIWVNTAFDPVANRVQYVYVLPDIVATVITLRLTPTGAQRRESREAPGARRGTTGHSTHVAVTYERTALSENANELVSQMAAHDRTSGPEWGQQINSHLKATK